MYLDVADLMAFYECPLGRAAKDILRARIRSRWPKTAGECVVGLGYATPYLSALRTEAERTLAFMPAAQGVTHWPPGEPSAAALVLEDALPLPQGCADRILLAHALEVADAPRELLDESWRVLAPGGRLLAMVPSRRGLWSRSDSSPFGYGRPFTRRQLTSLLSAARFTPVGWGEALYVPPSRRWSRRNAIRWERVGAQLWPAFPGVIIVEAMKEMREPIPARAFRARRTAGALAPAPALAPCSAPFEAES